VSLEHIGGNLIGENIPLISLLSVTLTLFLLVPKICQAWAFYRELYKKGISRRNALRLWRKSSPVTSMITVVVAGAVVGAILASVIFFILTRNPSAPS
jgi:hypothetical protein